MPIETAKMGKKIPKEELDSVVNYMVVDFGYSTTMCFTQKDATAILASFGKGERVGTYYAHEKLEFADSPPEIKVHVISQKEYREQKMNKLLGIEGEGDGS